MKISKQTLELFLEDAKESGDAPTIALIESLIDTQKLLQSEITQKNSLIKSSAKLLESIKAKEAAISEISKCIETQSSITESATASFRKVFDLAVFGNKLFNCEPLLRLWLSVEKLVGSNAESFNENNINMMAVLAELNSDALLCSMRDDMINFKEYMESTNETANKEGIADTAGDNA